jgi:hypothetical protein
MFGHVAKKKAIHTKTGIASVVDYVRKGKPNNFD